MKKLLLGLGTLSLIALPVLVVMSCSPTTTPTLETEKAKFKTSVTLITNVESRVAALAIQNATNIDAQKTALNLYYKTPVLETGFLYVIESAVVSSDNLSNLDVIITVLDEKNNHTENVALQITGFKAAKVVDFSTDLNKIENISTSNTDLTAKAVYDELKAAENQSEKDIIINKYFSPSSPFATGFNLIFVSSIVNTNKTILNVVLKLEKDGQFSIDKNIELSEFKDPADFSGELIKLISKDVEFSKSFKKPSEAVTEFKNSNQKDNLLADYYNFTTEGLNAEYKPMFVSAIVDNKSKTAIILTVKLLYFGEFSESKNITITGFKPENSGPDIELSGFAAKTIISADNDINVVNATKNATWLKKYFNFTNEDDFNKIVITFVKIDGNTIDGSVNAGSTIKIKLYANPGYIFPGEDKTNILVSNIIRISGNLSISVIDKLEWFNNNAEVLAEKSRLDTIFSGNDNSKKLEELKKNFNGDDLLLENIPYIIVTFSIEEDSSLNIKGLTYKIIGKGDNNVGAANIGITKTNWNPITVNNISNAIGQNNIRLTNDEIDSVKSGILPEKLVKYLFKGDPAELLKIPYLYIELFNDRSQLVNFNNFGPGAWMISIKSNAKYKLSNNQLLSRTFAVMYA